MVPIRPIWHRHTTPIMVPGRALRKFIFFIRTFFMWRSSWKIWIVKYFFLASAPDDTSGCNLALCQKCIEPHVWLFEPSCIVCIHQFHLCLYMGSPVRALCNVLGSVFSSLCQIWSSDAQLERELPVHGHVLRCVFKSFPISTGIFLIRRVVAPACDCVESPIVNG